MKQFLTMLLYFFMLTHLLAQEADTLMKDTLDVEAPATIATDNEYENVTDEEVYEDELLYPEPAYLPADSMDSMRNKPAFGYIKNLDSLLRNLQVEVAENKDEKPASKSIFDLGFVKGLIWALAIFAVLYILYQLFAGQQNLFYRNKKIAEENTPGIDIKKEVSHLILSQQAAGRGNFREAVRHQYNYILQLMHEKQYIHFQPQKTNDYYLKEVRKKPLSSDFAKLTLQFEYVWYGEFSLNAQQYETIAGGYRKFIETWL